MFEGFTNISNVLLGTLISTVSSVTLVPIMIEILFKSFNQFKLKDSQKELMKLIASHYNEKPSLSDALYKKEDSQQEDSQQEDSQQEDSQQEDSQQEDSQQEDSQQDQYISTPPSSKPPKFDFNILYLLQSPTLEELYEKRNLDKSLKKISFTLAVIMTIVGTVILFTGIIISLFNNKEIGWITTSSGAIIEVVASIYFWLVSKTMKEVKDNSKQLEKTEDLLTAIELIEKISETSMKDEAYKNIIDNLISPKNK